MGATCWKRLGCGHLDAGQAFEVLVWVLESHGRG